MVILASDPSKVVPVMTTMSAGQGHGGLSSTNRLAMVQETSPGGIGV